MDDGAAESEEARAGGVEVDGVEVAGNLCVAAAQVFGGADDEGAVGIGWRRGFWGGGLFGFGILRGGAFGADEHGAGALPDELVGGFGGGFDVEFDAAWGLAVNYDARGQVEAFGVEDGADLVDSLGDVDEAEWFIGEFRGGEECGVQGRSQDLDVGWRKGVGCRKATDCGVLVEFIGVDVDVMGGCFEGNRRVWIDGFFEG